ncbi:MAG TPA: hypothetical protein HA257_09870 [Candidatus Methanoperedenaceae archaeon]|nr:hypothetical protein [Candidatus Methanoperedenaceae archaeon]
MGFEELNAIIVIAGFVVFIVLALMILRRAVNMDIQYIRARVFLDKNFLVNNLLLILASGVLLAFHEFFSIGQKNGFVPSGLDIFSEVLEKLSLWFLIAWMYSWRKLLG